MASGALQRPIVGGTGSESLSVIMARAQQQATAQSAQILSAANNIAKQRERAGQAAESAAFRLRMEGFQRMQFDQKKKIEDARLSISQDANKRAEDLQPLTKTSMGLDNDLKQLAKDRDPLERRVIEARLERAGLDNEGLRLEQEWINGIWGDKMSATREEYRAGRSRAELEAQVTFEQKEHLDKESFAVDSLGKMLQRISEFKKEASYLTDNDPYSLDRTNDSMREQLEYLPQKLKQEVAAIVNEEPLIYRDSKRAEEALMAVVDQLGMTDEEQRNLAGPMIESAGLGSPAGGLDVASVSVNAKGETTARYEPNSQRLAAELATQRRAAVEAFERDKANLEGSIKDQERLMALEGKKESPNESKMTNYEGAITAKRSDIRRKTTALEQELKDLEEEAKKKDAKPERNTGGLKFTLESGNGLPTGDGTVPPLIPAGIDPAAARDASAFLKQELGKP